MNKFLDKRKQEKRHSLMIDDFDISSYNNDTLTTSDSIENHILNCCICKTQNKSSFIILSCDHIYHIKCITDTDIPSVIDKSYIKNRKCKICEKSLDYEESLYIHTKLLKMTNKDISEQEDFISNLTTKIDSLKEELRVHYEYKQKLEYQRDKSKQITKIITTLI
jgi:hypothetical protein